MANNSKKPEILFRLGQYGKWKSIDETQNPEDLPNLYNHIEVGGRPVLIRYFLDMYIHELFIQIRVDSEEIIIKK